MFRKFIAVYLVAAMSAIAMVPHVEGAFAPSEVMGALQGDRAVDMEKLRAALENKLVTQRLRDLGFTPEEVESRLSGLSDGQLHALAQKLDDLEVGGDALGVAIGVVLLIILIVVLLKLLDKEIIIR